MDKKEIIQKIIQKKEYSQLPKKDVELAFSLFDKPQYIDEEKIKLTRNLLRRVYASFSSTKLLQLKDKDVEWFLKKHKSTKERFNNYNEIYARLLKGFENELTIFDLGAGINGLSYKFLTEIKKKFYYIGIEAIGQLVDLMKYHFKTRGIENCHALHYSLFDLDKIRKVIAQGNEDKIIFLFKTLDSLEMLERNYSKKLLLELTPLVNKVVVSFATKSIGKRSRFGAKRTWLLNFINENFNLLDDFEISGERYLVFKNE